MPARARAVLVIAFVAVAAGIAVLVWSSRAETARRAAAAGPTTHPTAPDPSLAPEQIVRAVLAALKGNDAATDDGLRTTFRFASPVNQASTGPAERFAEMVKRPPYDRLLNHRAASVRKVDGNDAVVWMLVKVIGREGGIVYFGWQLSKQGAGPYNGCWMTDAVVPTRPPPDEAQGAEQI